MEVLIIVGLFIGASLPMVIGGFIEEVILPKFPKLMKWLDKMVDKL